MKLIMISMNLEVAHEFDEISKSLVHELDKNIFIS